jgi:hypothetical protein
MLKEEDRFFGQAYNLKVELENKKHHDVNNH